MGNVQMSAAGPGVGVYDVEMISEYLEAGDVTNKT
jgi:hypothetical protein